MVGVVYLLLGAQPVQLANEGRHPPRGVEHRLAHLPVGHVFHDDGLLLQVLPKKLQGPVAMGQR